MANIVVDYSKFTAEWHRTPPKFGNYIFEVAGGETPVLAKSLKEAVNSTKRYARRLGVFSIVLLRASEIKKK